MQTHSIGFWLVILTLVCPSPTESVGQRLFPFHGDITLYFPKHDLYEGNWIGLNLRERLAMYNEASLANAYSGLDVIRLTKAGWYDPENYIIRIEKRKNRIELKVKKLHRLFTTIEIDTINNITKYEQIEYDSGSASYELASYSHYYFTDSIDTYLFSSDSLVENSRDYINPVKCIIEKEIFKKDWDGLMKLFSVNGFFEMAPIREEWRMDGHDLLLEFHDQNGYYFVNRFLEGEPAFNKIFEFIYGLADPLMKTCLSDQAAINYFNECISIEQQRALLGLEAICNNFISLNYPAQEIQAGYRAFLKDVSERKKKFILVDSGSIVKTNASIKQAFGTYYNERQASFLQWSRFNVCLLKSSNGGYIDSFVYSKVDPYDIDPVSVSSDIASNNLNLRNELIKFIFLTEVVFRFLYLEALK